MAKNSASSSAGGSRPVSPLLVWSGVVFFLTFLILATRLFAPDKPVTPKASKVEYASSKDAALLNPADFGPPGSRSPHSRKRGNAEPEGKWVAAKESDPIHVTGTVTDADTGEPIADATVNVGRIRDKEENAALHEAEKAALVEESNMTPAESQGESGPARKHFEELDSLLRTGRVTKTDTKGAYRIGLPCPGWYTALAFHQGYLNSWSRPEKTDLKIAEGQTEARIDIKLSRGATISGRVTERGTGKGAAGVGVNAYLDSAPGAPWASRPNPLEKISIIALGRYRGEFFADTDAKGNYKVTGLPVGEYSAGLSIGDAPYRFAGLPPMRALRIDQLGQDIANVNFVLEPAGVVWGYVFDETGTPVDRAEVIQCYSDSVIAQVAEAATNLRPPITDSTNSEGLYRLVGPPLDRECRVFVMAKEHSPQISDPFVLTPTEREIRVDVYLTSGSTVYGRVLSSRDNSPIEKAHINCMPAVSKLFSPFNAALGFRETRSKKDGTFTIPHLPVGEHKIFATAERYKLSLQGEPIFSDGSTDLRVDIMLDPVDSGTHTVFGVVKNASGRPVPGAHLALANFGLEALTTAMGARDTTADAKGNYLFEGVEEGTLFLIADAKGYTSTRVDKVNLDEATDIELESAARVSGRVVIRETQQPPVACGVRAYPSSTPQGDLLSSLESLQGHVAQCTNGEFTLELPKGDYLLVADPRDASPGRLQVSVDSGEQVDGIVIEVSVKGGRIAGTVVMRDGKSPAGAIVSLGQEGGSFAALVPLMEDLQVRSAQVAEDGSFEFARLSGGAYRLTAKLEGYAEGQSDVVTLQDGQTVTGVRIVLGSGGRLQGTVILGGEVAPGAIVTVVGAGIQRVANADRNGQYLIEDLPPGEYLAAAISPSQIASGRFLPSHGQVVIQDGQTTQYNFGDAQGATVEGLCTPQPPAGNMGFAILRIAGTGEEISQLDFRSLTSWYTGGMSSAPSVVGLAQLDRDGWFRIENAPEGTFSLDVYYLSMGNLFTSKAQRVFTTMVNITGTNAVSLDIAVSQ